MGSIVDLYTDAIRTKVQSEVVPFFHHISQTDKARAINIGKVFRFYMNKYTRELFYFN